MSFLTLLRDRKLVKKVLERFYIKSDILSWKGKKPIKNIQSLARKKRYELLFTYCDKFNINNIDNVYFEISFIFHFIKTFEQVFGATFHRDSDFGYSLDPVNI